MIVVTDTGPIRLAASAPPAAELTANERAWISLLRDIGGGTTPPPTLAAVQALRAIGREG